MYCMINENGCQQIIRFSRKLNLGRIGAATEPHPLIFEMNASRSVKKGFLPFHKTNLDSPFELASTGVI